MALPQVPLVPLGPFLDANRVLFFGQGTNKQTALWQLASCCARDANLDDPQQFHQAITEREAIGSTGIGNGIAVPHCKLPAIDGFIIAIGIASDGLPYEATDGQDVQLMVMIGAGDSERKAYLRLLATVASVLKDPERQKNLLACTDPNQIIALLTAATAGAA